jgi:hypothetical protein
MVVVGMFTVWFGYTVGLYGYCLCKGYDVGFKELIIPSEYPGWASISSSASSSTSSGSGSSQPQGKAVATGHTPKGTPVPITTAPGGTSRFGV